MSGHTTRSDIPVNPLYTPEDLKGFDYDEKLGEPGSYPYTRGIRPVGFWGWIQRELSGEGDAKTSNKQLKYLLSQGQTGIDVIADAPSNAMMDPDHPLAVNAVGTQGVSVCCLQDFRDLWKDLPLDAVTVSSSMPALLAACALYLVARDSGVPSEKLRGSTIQAPLYAESCGYSTHLPFDLRLRMSSDCIEFCTKTMPKFHSFVEDTYFFCEAGLNAVEEMALGFVEIRYLVRDLLKRGLDIDSFAPRIAILVDCGMDFFEEIAKIRATRRLFAKMMKEEFGARDKRSWAPVITSHTSGMAMTAQQPSGNIIRGTLQSLALVLGGVQAVEISAFDEAYRTPSPESHRVGLRTQQIIGLETNVTQVVDPLAGSYYVETLTDQVEAGIRAMIEEIESKGDPGKLSEEGWFKRFFENTMARYARQVEDGELPKVGLNCFQIPPEEDTLLKEVSVKKIEPYRDQIEKIIAFKKNRNHDRLASALGNLLESTRNKEENTSSATIEALEAKATVGEIAGVMRQAYGLPYDPFGKVEPVI
ncbi:MAG: methylmalonyl-CoA mutase [Proteobacteria bacterium]|nr:methylmalonyl-CoA mutase [Pseudomonadota bacterium]